jgi:hypothetical protein
MPTSFSLADQDVLDLLDDVMRDRHRPLFDAGVKVGVVMAVSDTADAVTHAGHSCYAKIKVVPLIDRLTKGFDAQLLIDLRKWRDELRHRQRIALLDHELSHLELAEYAYAPVLDGDNRPTGEQEIVGVERDDLDRPKLRLVKGDVNAGDGFARVIERNGEDALEWLNYTKAHEFAERAAAGELAGAEG